MARRQKQTTCFDGNTSTSIKGQLFYIIGNHNRLIVDPVLAKLDMQTMLETFVPPVDRDFVKAVDHRFGPQLKSGAYLLRLKKLRWDIGLSFGWATDPAKEDAHYFAVPDHYQNLDFHEALQPTMFAIELNQMLEEYIDNAIKWGIVWEVFRYLNEERVQPKDYASMVYYLPMIVPLVSRFNSGLAENMKALKPPRNPWAIEPRYLDGLRHANRMLAAAAMLPQTEAVTHVVHMVIDAPEVRTPLWPHPVPMMRDRV